LLAVLARLAVVFLLLELLMVRALLG
jgi:hypothetical protein